MGHINYSFLENGKIGFQSRVGEVGVVKFTTPATRHWVEGKITIGPCTDDKVHIIVAPPEILKTPEYVPGPTVYPGDTSIPAMTAPPHVHKAGDPSHIVESNSKVSLVNVTKSIRHIWIAEDSNGQVAVPGTEQYTITATYNIGKGNNEIELVPNKEYYVCMDYRNKDHTFVGPRGSLGETDVEVSFKNV